MRSYFHYGMILFLLFSCFTVIWILIENTYGNEVRNIRDHFQKVFTIYGSVKALGERRFQMLFHAFDPSLEQLKQLTSMLSDAAKRYFISSLPLIDS